MRAMRARAAARLLSIAQASDEFGIPGDSLRRLIATKRLPAVELPGIRRVLLDRQDLEAAIDDWKTCATRAGS